MPSIRAMPLARCLLQPVAAAALASFASPVWAASAALPAGPSTFCAAAALAAYPSPVDQGRRDPAVVAAQLAMVRSFNRTPVKDDLGRHYSIYDWVSQMAC